MHRRTLLGAVSALAVISLAACSKDDTTASAPGNGKAETLTIEHAQGKTEIPGNPQRVLVFDMSVLDTIEALGAGAAVVGVPTKSLPAHLKSYDNDKVANIGTLKEPDYDAVSKADPDLIIVARRTTDALKELSKIAPTIDVTPGSEQDFMTEFAASEKLIAQVFGKTDQAEQKLTALNTRIAALKPRAEKAGTGLILMTVGGKITAYGPGSRFGIIHDALGVPAADKNIKSENSHGESVNFEYIAKTNPDWLYVVDRDAATGAEGGKAAAEVLDNALVKQTKAWSQGQVVYLDPVRWYVLSAGLNNVDTMVGEVEKAVS